MTLALVGATVFVSPDAAQKMVDAGATVIDARQKPKAPFLPNARALDWMKLRDGWGRTGRLDDVESLDRAVEAAGVRSEQPVVVYGAMLDGWGEEGRIWWMLRYLGHSKTFIVDGGIRAWVEAGLPTASRLAKRTRGRFEPKLTRPLRASAETIQKTEDAKVLDTRTLAEFSGSTPYFSTRGGHVPGARHLDWRGLVGKDGRLRSVAHIRRRAHNLGLDRDAPVITYCTGGVRSAFVAAALTHAGFTRVANYDGSWWDWSSQRALPVSR